MKLCCVIGSMFFLEARCQNLGLSWIKFGTKKHEKFGAISSNFSMPLRLLREPIKISEVGKLFTNQLLRKTIFLPIKHTAFSNLLLLLLFVVLVAVLVVLVQGGRCWYRGR